MPASSLKLSIFCYSPRELLAVSIDFVVLAAEWPCREFFFSHADFIFLMIELVMSLSLQAIVTPFFFSFKELLQALSTKPYLFFFNVLPLKFLCNPILKINISTE